MAGIFDELIGSQGGGPGLLGGLAGGVADAFGGQRGMMNVALGLMSGETPMEGARNAFGAFQKTNEQDQLRKVLIAQKMDPAMANAVINNPEVLKAVLTGYAKPVDAQHIVVGNNIFKFDPKTSQIAHIASVPEIKTDVNPENSTVLVNPPAPIFPGQQPPRPLTGGAPNIMPGTPGALPSPMPPALTGPMGGPPPPMPSPRPPGMPSGMPPGGMSPTATVADRWPQPQQVPGAKPVPIQSVPGGGSVQTVQQGTPKAPPGYTGGPKGQQIIPGGPAYNETIHKISEEFRQDKNVQAYQAIVPTIQSMREAVSTKGGAADLNIVVGFAKILDPGSIVHEGEAEAVRKTPGIPDRIWGIIESVQNGQKLDEKARKYIMDEAESRVRALARSHDQVVSHYSKRAQSMGIDPGKVIYSLENQTDQSSKLPLKWDGGWK